ncbi:hypothetical protein CALCODRAFT_11357 [Calocera cornea HHB12733]|uniref:WW domain-containing protein n=1 Tax=Calocera cornea HHB12733 TaxID=1353952 RepID=A0A165J7G7_9BASI|nr:hypothetical protein CALCODRAFT_11357 [Calocera cornea HHB12733]
MESPSNSLPARTSSPSSGHAAPDGEGMELVPISSPPTLHINVAVVDDPSESPSSSLSSVDPSSTRSALSVALAAAAVSTNRLSLSPSIVSTTSTSNDSDRSDATCVASAIPSPSPLARRPTRSTALPLVPEPSAQAATTGAGAIIPGPITSSPINITGPTIATGGPNASGEPRSPYIDSDLDPEVQDDLHDLTEKHLVCVRPSVVADQIYDKPAGFNYMPKDDPLGRPRPNRMRSGLFSSGDDLDRDIDVLPAGDLKQKNWTEYLHPGGMRYFGNDAWSVLTDDYIRRHGSLERVSEWAELIHTVMKKQRFSTRSTVRWPEAYELYIGITKDSEGTETCYYYLMDTVKRHPFWLHSFPTHQDFFHEMPQGASSHLVDLYLTHEFWCHRTTFPHGTRIRGSERDLRKMLITAVVAMNTCPFFSTAPFLAGQPATFLQVLDWCKEQAADCEVANWTIARLNAVLCRNGMLNRFGDFGVRMDRRQPSVNDEAAPQIPPWGKVIPYAIMHLLFFGGDIQYLHTIRLVVIDDYIAPQSWQDLMQHLVDSSKQSNIISALLFTANIGYLAIQPLLPDQSIVSLLSALLSFASLLVGIKQARDHNKLVKTTAFDGSAYFHKAKHSWLGYRGLALYYALPWALLSWSILTVLVSIFLFSFQNVATAWGTRSIIIAVSAILLLVVAIAFKYSHGLTSNISPRLRARRCWVTIAAEGITSLVGGSTAYVWGNILELTSSFRSSNDGLVLPPPVTVSSAGQHQ